MGVDKTVTQNSEVRIQKAEGKVVELLPSGLVRLDVDGRAEVLAHAAGASVMNAMRLRAGDRVEVVLSPHDRGRGRITKVLRTS